MNLPNKLTIFRIILVPIMIIIPFFNIQGDFLNLPIELWLVNLVFIIASITDNLDGRLARKNNQVTTFGKFADPLADKILVIAALVMLVEYTRLPAWIPVVVLAREFIVSGYRLIAVEKGGKVIAASFWGKLKTVTQMIAIIGAFLDTNAFFAFAAGNITGLSLGINIIWSVMMVISVIATVFSGWDYVKDGKDLLKD